MAQGPLILLLFTLVTALGAADEAQAALERTAAVQRAHTTAQGTLTQRTRRLDDPAAPPRVQQVRFLVQFPDRYCVVFTKPGDDEFRQSFLSDGRRRWEVTQTFAGDKPDVKTAAIGEGDELMRRLVGCLRLDLAELGRDFRIEPRLADGGLLVTMTPLKPALAESLSAVVVDFAADGRLRRFVCDDPQGNRYEYTVDAAAYDQPIDPAVFRWDQ